MLLQLAQNVRTIALTPVAVDPGLFVIITVLALTSWVMPCVMLLTLTPNRLWRSPWEEREMDTNTLLKVTNLQTFFYTLEGVVRAVNGVNLAVGRQRILGVVGESGCGKSVMSYSMLNLVGANGKVVDGEIFIPQRRWDGCRYRKTQA